MSSGHSFLPPSGAATWSVCALWPTMNSTFPQDDTPEYLEGTAAHWVWQKILDNEKVGVGDVAPNGIIVTSEMMEGAELYASIMPNVKRELLVVETPVSIYDVHPECYGTPDSWYFDIKTRTLDLFDYKFEHRFVDEYENLQCLLYVEGILNRLALQLKIGQGELDQRITVRITIVQPRCYYKGEPVRTWTLKGSDIRGYINKLKLAAELAHAPNPVATTNEGCRDCPGRHACDALQKGAYSDLQYSSRSSPIELPLIAAALELKMMENGLARLQSRVEGMREFVLARLAAGEYSPYYSLKQTFGNRKWSKPDDEVLILGTLLGVDLSKKSVITPSQALNLSIDEAVIRAYSYVPMGLPKLTTNKPNDASKIFNKE